MSNFRSDEKKRAAYFLQTADETITDYWRKKGFTPQKLADVLEIAYCRGREKYIDIEHGGGDPRHHALDDLITFLIGITDNCMEDPKSSAKYVSERLDGFRLKPNAPAEVALRSLASELSIRVVEKGAGQSR